MYANIGEYLFHLGSSEENHLPNFLKSDVTDDVVVTSWVGDDVICQFCDDSITAKGDNDITKSMGTTIHQTSRVQHEHTLHTALTPYVQKQEGENK